MDSLNYKSCRWCRKPKMTAEEIREKDRERARKNREKNNNNVDEINHLLL